MTVASYSDRQTDPLEFKRVLSAWTTGVTVVTAHHDGDLVGLVSNSFASVSLDPPLVSWCVDRGSSSLKSWLAAESFAVHILASHETELVSRFARRGGDKFAGQDWAPGATGAPLLDAGVARVECRTWQRYDGGDHVIIVGRVVALHDAGGPALAFSRGALLPAPAAG